MKTPKSRSGRGGMFETGGASNAGRFENTMMATDATPSNTVAT